MPDSESNRRRESSSTSRSLLVRIKDRDSEAWNRLVDLYAPLVYHWCRAMDVSEQDVADIVQDVFQSLTRKIADFRKERPEDTFRGWLRVVTRNKVYDHFRRLGRQPSSTGGTDAQTRMAEFPDTLTAADDGSIEERDLGFNHLLFTRALELIRGEFADNAWQSFWQTVVNGRTATEVGEELGMKPGTVRVAKSRVLHRLRIELGDLFD